MTDPILLVADAFDTEVTLDYTNHRGERAKRLVEPVELWWGTTAWHPEPGLLLKVYDLEKHVHRDFAVKDIHGVEHGRMSD